MLFLDLIREVIVLYRSASTQNQITIKIKIQNKKNAFPFVI